MAGANVPNRYMSLLLHGLSENGAYMANVDEQFWTLLRNMKATQHLVDKFGAQDEFGAILSIGYSH